jgi:hypothetical protein
MKQQTDCVLRAWGKRLGSGIFFQINEFLHSLSFPALGLAGAF